MAVDAVQNGKYWGERLGRANKDKVRDEISESEDKVAIDIYNQFKHTKATSVKKDELLSVLAQASSVYYAAQGEKLDKDYAASFTSAAKKENNNWVIVQKGDKLTKLIQGQSHYLINDTGATVYAKKFLKPGITVADSSGEIDPSAKALKDHKLKDPKKLQEGMLLRLPISEQDSGTLNAEGDNYRYTTESKDKMTNPLEDSKIKNYREYKDADGNANHDFVETQQGNNLWQIVKYNLMSRLGKDKAGLISNSDIQEGVEALLAEGSIARKCNQIDAKGHFSAGQEINVSALADVAQGITDYETEKASAAKKAADEAAKK